MTSSTNNLNPAAATPAAQAQPFRWLNPTRPSAFRIIVGLGIGAFVLLMINLFTPGALEASAYVWGLAAAAIAYLLAEVLLVTIVVVGPFAGFIYGVIAYFSR